MNFPSGITERRDHGPLCSGFAARSIGPVWAGSRGRLKAGSLANTRGSWNLPSRETCNIPAATSAGLAILAGGGTEARRAAWAEQPVVLRLPPGQLPLRNSVNPQRRSNTYRRSSARPARHFPDPNAGVLAGLELRPHQPGGQKDQRVTAGETAQILAGGSVMNALDVNARDTSRKPGVHQQFLETSPVKSSLCRNARAPARHSFLDPTAKPKFIVESNYAGRSSERLGAGRILR